MTDEDDTASGGVDRQFRDRTMKVARSTNFNAVSDDDQAKKMRRLKIRVGEHTA